MYISSVLLMILIMLIVFFLGSVQPMVMVSSLILVTLVYSYYVYMVMGGYWFSYALVMVMLSGVLVLFSYMISLTPNESFEMYNLVILFIIMIFMVIKCYYYFNDVSYLSMVLWMSYVSVYNLFVVGFLFSLMLMVVWLGWKMEGAVRIG